MLYCVLALCAADDIYCVDGHRADEVHPERTLEFLVGLHLLDGRIGTADDWVHGEMRCMLLHKNRNSA